MSQSEINPVVKKKNLKMYSLSVAVGSKWPPLPACRLAGETLKLRIMRKRGKCAASSFLRRDHPNPGDRISDHR
jgi:hypothetical protein